MILKNFNILISVSYTHLDVYKRQGVHQIDTVEQAALALKPLAGNLAYLLFAIGAVSYTHLDVYKRQTFDCL